MALAALPSPAATHTLFAVPYGRWDAHGAFNRFGDDDRAVPDFDVLQYKAYSDFAVGYITDYRHVCCWKPQHQAVMEAAAASGSACGVGAGPGVGCLWFIVPNTVVQCHLLDPDDTPKVIKRVQHALGDTVEQDWVRIRSFVDQQVAGVRVCVVDDVEVD